MTAAKPPPRQGTPGLRACFRLPAAVVISGQLPARLSAMPLVGSGFEQGDEGDQCNQLGADGEEDEAGEGGGVEGTDDGGSRQPCDAVDGGEDAVSGPSGGGRDEVRDGGAERGFVDAQSRSPDDGAGPDQSRGWW